MRAARAHGGRAGGAGGYAGGWSASWPGAAAPRARRAAPRRPPTPSRPRVARFGADSGAGFVLKNADSLDSHCALALGNSSVPFVKALIEFGQQLAAGAAKAGKHGARRAGGLGLSGGSASASSLGRRFIGELDTLVKALSAGGCHFVRCVAPSGSGGIAGAALRSFDAGAVARQLRADGTFDAVRMLKHGYPVRVPFAQLHARFLPLLASASPQVEQLEPSQFGELLAAVVGVKPADCALGSTRIFLRGAAAIAFDELRAKDTAEVLPILTAKMAEWEAKRRAAKQLAPRLLGWHVRVLFQKKRRSAVALQARARGMHSRVRAMELQRARQAERLAVRRTEKAQAAAAAATTARARRRSTVDPQQERVASAALGELAEYVRAQQGGAIDFDRITEAGSQPSTRTATPRAPDGLAFGRAREAAVRQTLANRDYAMLENEMRTLVARQRAEDAAAQAGLTPRSHTNAYLTAEQRARAALSELDDDDDALIQRHALLRPPTSWIAAKAGSLELIVLEEGSALPVYRRMLKREEISRLRFVFDEWDMDHVRALRAAPRRNVALRSRARRAHRPLSRAGRDGVALRVLRRDAAARGQGEQDAHDARVVRRGHVQRGGRERRRLPRLLRVCALLVWRAHALGGQQGVEPRAAHLGRSEADRRRRRQDAARRQARASRQGSDASQARAAEQASTRRGDRQGAGRQRRGLPLEKVGGGVGISSRTAPRAGRQTARRRGRVRTMRGAARTVGTQAARGVWHGVARWHALFASLLSVDVLGRGA